MAACIFCRQGLDHMHKGQCSGCDMFILFDDYDIIFEPNDMERFYCSNCQKWFVDKESAAEYFSRFFGDEELRQFFNLYFPACDSKESLKAFIMSDFLISRKMEYLQMKGFMHDAIFEIRERQRL